MQKDRPAGQQEALVLVELALFAAAIVAWNDEWGSTPASASPALAKMKASLKTLTKLVKELEKQ